MSDSIPPLSSIAFCNLNRYKRVPHVIECIGTVGDDGVLHLKAKNPDEEWLLEKAFEGSEVEDSEATA